MAFSVQMPALGESVTEGTVTRWLKKEGDAVAVDEPLLEVSTDKVDTEIPSPVAGILTKIVAQEDDTVDIGGELAIIGETGEALAPSGGSPSVRAAEISLTEEAAAPPAPVHTAQPVIAPVPTPSAGSGSSHQNTVIRMPELGESVTEGTVTRWLKSVGDEIAADEPLLEVSTDKVDTEIPSPVSGTLLEISAVEDATVAVGGPLAVVGAHASVVPAPPSTPVAPTAPINPPPAAVSAESAVSVEVATPAPEVSSDTPYVTPLVRKLATENNVDLNAVQGTGVGGRIRKQDVLAAAQTQAATAISPVATPATPVPLAPASTAGSATRPELGHLRGTTQTITRIRQITAKKTRESLQNSAQLTQTFEVDVTKIAALRAKAKTGFAEREGVNLTFLPFFAKAVVEALKAHPNINASINEEAKEITYHDAEHLGIAVDTEQGLLSPVIHNAGDLSLVGLARAIADIAARARSNGLKPDELAGGTFTITNIGSQGALFDTPILVPPQAAMLGTGAIVKRPVVITDDNGAESIGVRSMVYLPLTYDHRLIDGADAGRFLTTIKHRLEEAAFEADLGL
ncbi:MAG: 2-oxoglutarate dehydrogenase, E2 component, dihydrolipoamide succinyltransferase [Mycobacteriaceae bacterium]